MIHSPVFDFLVSNGLSLFPLHSISSDGVCTCQLKEKCSSPGKHPLLRYNWKYVATNKDTEIKRWLDKTGINWGVPTGRKSTSSGKFLVVFDMDDKDEDLLQILPKTFSYSTGKGRHFWYWSKYPIQNSVKKVAPNTDVRGVGGYVVIPPSKHRLGRAYSVDDWNMPIAEMTHEMYSLVYSERKQPKAVGLPKKRLNRIQAVKDVSFWQTASVETLRKKLQTEKIPVGQRNKTIHRLLSSDRARGYSEEQLLLSAVKYQQACADSEDLTASELTTLVRSVSRYDVGFAPPTKTRTESYFAWLEAKNKALSSEEKSKIVDSESCFFSKLKPGNDRVSLQEVLDTYNLFMANNRKLSRFTRYSPVAFGKKMKELGIERFRTAKSNFWLIDLERLKSLLKPAIMKKETITVTEEQPAVLAMSNTKISGDNVFKVKVKVKTHPNEQKYVERATYESMAAFGKLMQMLTPEQLQEFFMKTLILEPDDTEAFMAEVKPGDIIGYAQYRDGEGMHAGLMTVLHTGGGCFVGDDLSKEKKPLALSMSDLSIALNIGFLEILYRDNKPYGLPEEQEIEVRIHRVMSGSTTSPDTSDSTSPNNESKTEEVKTE